MTEKQKFTVEQIRILEDNPYTLYATHTKIFHAKEFKETYCKMYQQGMQPRNIIKELGYDEEILGKRYTSMYPTRLKEELNRKGCFGEGKARNKLKALKNTDYDKMQDKKAMRSMQAEIKYLRQEIDFLKKLIELANSKE